MTALAISLLGERIGSMGVSDTQGANDGRIAEKAASALQTFGVEKDEWIKR